MPGPMSEAVARRMNAGEAYEDIDPQDSLAIMHDGEDDDITGESEGHDPLDDLLSLKKDEDEDDDTSSFGDEE